ncbi:putative cell wall [Phaeomoniella chlamydospora]|uniref:Putative cell wall n=1 Tax=Phaeomoniella chlamydospora TaxID=158046 RepID=A0A0G2DZG6_PHACM|nr:putative cell wall [Phaeomoniella chlamydospora]
MVRKVTLFALFVASALSAPFEPSRNLALDHSIHARSFNSLSTSVSFTSGVAIGLEACLSGATPASIGTGEKEALKVWLNISGPDFLSQSCIQSLISWCDGSSIEVSVVVELKSSLSVAIDVSAGGLVNLLNNIIDTVAYPVETIFQESLSKVLTSLADVSEEVLSSLKICASGGVASSLSVDAKVALEAFIKSADCPLDISLQIAIRVWLNVGSSPATFGTASGTAALPVASNSSTTSSISQYTSYSTTTESIVSGTVGVSSAISQPVATGSGSELLAVSTVYSTVWVTASACECTSGSTSSVPAVVSSVSEPTSSTYDPSVSQTSLLSSIASSSSFTTFPTAGVTPSESDPASSQTSSVASLPATTFSSESVSATTSVTTSLISTVINSNSTLYNPTASSGTAVYGTTVSSTIGFTSASTSTASSASYNSSSSAPVITASSTASAASSSSTGSCTLTGNALSGIEDFVNSSDFLDLDVSIRAALKAAVTGGVAASLSTDVKADISAFLSAVDCPLTADLIVEVKAWLDVDIGICVDVKVDAWADISASVAADIDASGSISTDVQADLKAWLETDAALDLDANVQAALKICADGELASALDLIPLQALLTTLTHDNIDISVELKATILVWLSFSSDLSLVTTLLGDIIALLEDLPEVGTIINAALGVCTAGSPVTSLSLDARVDLAAFLCSSIGLDIDVGVRATIIAWIGGVLF